METNLLGDLLNKNDLQKAEKILRSCVHCGFCLSGCPTYKVLGDEANSPRGRIYTIKAMLEDENFDDSNLDKCLICKSCETACPSGVEYSQLLEIGKKLTYKNKSLLHKAPRYILRKTLTTPFLVNLISKKSEKIIQQKFNKSVILHTGCVQKPLAPNINNSTIKVLNKLGFEVIETSQKECCGAIDLHNGGHNDGVKLIKNNIDNWLKMLEKSEVIISTASGCGVTIKDYSTLFEMGDAYFEKAKKISEKTLDIAQFLSDKDLSVFDKKNIKISYHEPCTLQHGQNLGGSTHQILQKIGYGVEVIKDNNLCCGSAGTYSIFEPKISKELKKRKLANLGDCDVIATSNIGCLMHLQKGNKTPVKHWIELLID
jgi:glycolate oxidase iron-sulfur subunit